MLPKALPLLLMISLLASNSFAATVPAGDGCNTCETDGAGNIVACTLAACYHPKLFLAQAEPVPPRCEPVGGELNCHCYSNEDLAKIAGAITKLKVCESDLAARETLIKDRLLDHPPTVPAPESFQDLHWVVGGLVVSAALGGALVFWAVHK